MKSLPSVYQVLSIKLNSFSIRYSSKPTQITCLHAYILSSTEEFCPLARISLDLPWITCTEKSWQCRSHLTVHSIWAFNEAGQSKNNCIHYIFRKVCTWPSSLIKLASFKDKNPFIFHGMKVNLALIVVE